MNREDIIMKTVKISRALGLGVTAVLVTSAFPFSPASAAVPTATTLVATSADGAAFQLADYTTGDVTVQATDGTGKVDVDDFQDLTYSWSVTPFAPGSTPVTVPVSGNDLQLTDTDGKFVVALPVSQGPGTYTLTAGLTDDAAGDNGIGDAQLLTVTVGNAAPTGSTAVITGLAGSKPGLAQNGTLTVTAPDATYGPADGAPDPVAGQVFTVTVDHGFFTDGKASNPSVVGALAGDLASLGTKLTGLTDAAGKIDFKVGIARDAGFDDDGQVTASVAVAGGVSATKNAAWSTAKPLNGQVAVTLSPASEQENPVNPALAGNRTFYDVFARDQFGNPVDDESIDLTYSGYLKDYDYSDDDTVSDFDTFGDIWVLSNVAGTINVNALWEDAPTFRYTDTAGTAVAGKADATGTAAASTYELNFNASTITMTPSVSDTVKVGTAVTHTVRVVDQQGNPVSGYQVSFLRYGPDDVRGDVVATPTTNAFGEASYTFVGTKRGRSTITANVSDGNRRRELTGRVYFGKTIKAHLARGKNGSGADRLAVSARTNLAAGARVNVYRIVKGKQKLVGSKRLSSKGSVAFSIRDRNRNAKTKYVAVIRSTTKSIADQSNSVTIR